ncbi:unnamed protein product [Rotaria socialis]|uniref:Uncharacterized protein n=1 Tax=Rotaria socialis TaxID=392032 RepID=A0A821U3A8_9BILA|nr:unnamed protein product [Rotaria socialis]CAF4883918.1 unnamed protein product [Rotaria socialis]
MYWTNGFVFVTCILAVQPQTWVGTYAVGSTCNVNRCCCVSDVIEITESTSTTLLVTTGLAGSCFGLATYSGGIVYTGGYSITLTISTITLSITLSADSNNITIINSMGTSCTTGAVRQSAMGPTTVGSSLIPPATSSFTSMGSTAVRQSTNGPTTARNSSIPTTTMMNTTTTVVLNTTTSSTIVGNTTVHSNTARQSTTATTLVLYFVSILFCVIIA